jgi:hypothetical protein
VQTSACTINRGAAVLCGSCGTVVILLLRRLRPEPDGIHSCVVAFRTVVQWCWLKGCSQPTCTLSYGAQEPVCMRAPTARWLLTW